MTKPSRKASLAAVKELRAKTTRARTRWHMLNEMTIHEVKEHLKKFPLTAGQRQSLVDVVRGGDALCCHGGLVKLHEIVDPLWAEVLNDWAYGRLGCRVNEDERAGFIAKLKLALDDGSIVKEWGRT